jgi:predicted ATPase
VRLIVLEKLRVSGFRSLRKFEMAIQPGLNILTGPNGAGAYGSSTRELPFGPLA